MAIDDHYATLGVSADSDANAIQSAYRALMRRYHPDVNASQGAASKAKAINEAYACLRDPAKRSSYDRTRPGPVHRPAAAPGPQPASTGDSTWTGFQASIRKDPRDLRPTWRQAVGLGVAATITAITFAATSAIGPFTMPPPSPDLVMQLRPATIPVRPPTNPEGDGPDRSTGEADRDRAPPSSSR